MAGFDDRLKSLQGLVLEAQDALANAPADHIENHPEQFARLERALGYSAIVLAKTDAPLLFDAAADEMQGALASLRDNIVTQPEGLDQWTASLLNGLARVPAARNEDMAQEAKDAAATLQRAASARASALTNRLNALQTEVTELEATVETRKQEVDTAFAERRAEADRIVTEMRNAVEESRSRVQQVETSQAEAFREAQEGRGTTFDEAMREQRTDFDEQAGQRDAEAEAFLERMRRREEETKTLVGAIGDYGTGGRYAKEVEEQKSQANRWRWITVAVALGAVGIAVWATVSADRGSIDDARLVSKVLVSAVLAGLAGYAAKQSSRHRGREEAARGLELDMAVFPVLIDSLDSDKQQAARERVLELTIGRPLVPADSRIDGGPSLADQIQEALKRGGDGASGGG